VAGTFEAEQRLDKGLGLLCIISIDVAKDMLVRNGEQEFRCILKKYFVSL
jgi:hypothetical protein